MTSFLNLQGFIRGVTYRAYLARDLKRYSFSEFDINSASPYGIIEFDDGEIAYSKWASPKRTRTYPFARIYNTYNTQKVLTVIPVIKDEGLDGDLDKLQYSTISWMNLLNVYIVLAYYTTAVKNNSKKQGERQKLTNQKFDNTFVKSQIAEISQYRQSALHWNKNLFEERFVSIFQNALAAYQQISQKTKVNIHPQNSLIEYLGKIREDFEEFKNISLRGSQQASLREVQTLHQLEHLNDGVKATICIRNYLGGIYYLTVDEVILNDEAWIIQESKNSNKDPIPGESDIQDGLFKLIIFSNLSSLQLDGIEVPFLVRLKLSGRGISTKVVLPCSEAELSHFFEQNNTFRRSHKDLIKKLQLEAMNNQSLTIEIGANE